MIQYILRPCLGAVTISVSFRKKFLVHKIVIKLKNKVWVEKYLCLLSSFLLSLNSLAAFHRQRSQQIKGVRRRRKESDSQILKPKINDDDDNNQTEQIITNKSSCAP